MNKLKNKEKKKKVLFISSTGGHLNELLQLSPLFEKYDSYIITEKDKANENLKNIYGKKLYFLPYGTRAKLFTYIFKYLFLCHFSFHIVSCLHSVCKLLVSLTDLPFYADK